MIHILNGRSERRPLVEKEMETQGITNYRLWEGIHDKNSVIRSINLGWKMIIDYARLRGFKDIVVVEDDIKFSHPNSYKYFIENKPYNFDLYLGVISLGQPDENNVVDDFCGMIMVCVNERFYEKFLSVSENEHIDRAMKGLGRFVVSSPMVCWQHDNIFSSTSGKVEDYSDRIKNYKFYNG